MFDRVGEVQLASGQAGLLEHAVEHVTGGSDEYVPPFVLDIAWLLTDKRDLGRAGAFAEDGLIGMLVQLAHRAARGGVGQAGERGGVRYAHTSLVPGSRSSVPGRVCK